MGLSLCFQFIYIFKLKVTIVQCLTLMHVQFKIVWHKFKMTCPVQEWTWDFVAANDVMLDHEWLPRGDARAKKGLGLEGEHWLANTTQTFHCDMWEAPILPRTEECSAKANKRTHMLLHRVSSVLLNATNLLLNGSYRSIWPLLDLISFCLQSNTFLNIVGCFWNRLLGSPINRF